MTATGFVCQDTARRATVSLVRYDDMGQDRRRRERNAGLWVAIGAVAIPLMLVADVMVFLDGNIGAGVFLLLLIGLDVGTLAWLWRSARQEPLP
jgi:hypothetical protein